MSTASIWTWTHRSLGIVSLIVIIVYETLGISLSAQTLGALWALVGYVLGAERRAR